jgi:5-methylcytosine-specific restriction endonuclease McrA
MYISKGYGHSINEKEVYDLIKQFDHESGINTGFLNLLYNSLIMSCNRDFDYTWSYQCCFRCPEDRNSALKKSIKTFRSCIDSFSRWGVNLNEIEAYIEELRSLRLDDLTSIKEKRRKLRHKKRTRRQYQKLRPTLKRQLENKFGSKCAYCESTEKLEIDHITPVFRKGDNDINNLQILCRNCHLIKSVNERRAA